jgi:molecular chaperone DnaK (HSP70)
MALETFVFKQADQMERVYNVKPPVIYGDVVAETVKENEDGTLEMKEDITLTEEEKENFNHWISDYNNWVEKNKEFDSVTSRKHREAANNLALIIVGLPLYLYHWMLIKKES